jgi:AcrR family transcriptional regulator
VTVTVAAVPDEPTTPAGEAAATGRPPAGVAAGRGEQTRARIVEAASRLFEERGYERTTMRAVAAEAGVSLGSAYYYFESKEQLVQGFYDRIQVLHREETHRRLAGRSAFADRLMVAVEAFVEVARPFHPFAGRLFAVASEPTSPLSPFSVESAAAREASIALFGDVVRGGDVKADARLLTELPELLWLAHMGVVLFWVHDRSEGQRRTLDLVRRAVPLVDRLVRISRLRPLRPVVHEVLDLSADLRGTA